MSESLSFDTPRKLELPVPPTLEADTDRIERMLEDDRRTIARVREQNARQRKDAERARTAVRDARRALRRAMRG